MWWLKQHFRWAAQLWIFAVTVPISWPQMPLRAWEERCLQVCVFPGGGGGGREWSMAGQSQRSTGWGYLFSQTCLGESTEQSYLCGKVACVCVCVCVSGFHE